MQPTNQPTNRQATMQTMKQASNEETRIFTTVCTNTSCVFPARDQLPNLPRFFLFLLPLQGLPLSLFLTIGGVVGIAADLSIESKQIREIMAEQEEKIQKCRAVKNASIFFVVRACCLIPSVKASDWRSSGGCRNPHHPIIRNGFS